MLSRLTVCGNQLEAYTLKNLLENEGIEAYLTNENFTNLMPGYIGMLGSGIHVMVQEEDMEKALKVLQRVSGT